MTGGLQLRPWPGGDPSAFGEAAARTIGILTAIPRQPPWGCYLAGAGAEVVGTCAFKAVPDGEGTVEIAYMTFPGLEGRGHATAMIAHMLDVARAGGASTVIAHTHPELNASSRALRRNGFVHADSFHDPDDGFVWYWERVLG